MIAPSLSLSLSQSPSSAEERGRVNHFPLGYSQSHCIHGRRHTAVVLLLTIDTAYTVLDNRYLPDFTKFGPHLKLLVCNHHIIDVLKTEIGSSRYLKTIHNNSRDKSKLKSFCTSLAKTDLIGILIKKVFKTKILYVNIGKCFSSIFTPRNYLTRYMYM